MPIPAYMQLLVLVSSKDAGLMKTETHCNIVKCHCSMTARNLMHIPHGKPFYVYGANLMAKPTNLPKVMIDCYASRAPARIPNAMNDEPYMLRSEGHF